MHLSLKSSLGRQILTGTYVKDNRVLDLTTPFSELTFTLDDRSGEGNDATLYSGRYVSTDGVADKAINADCSAAGSALYYLTAWVRSSTTGTKWAQVSPTSSCYFTVATANVWQQLISTTILSEDVPSDVALGFADSTFPLTYSAANWSDVRLINATTGATVARWQLNESADGDLDGYPALDSSGNGYHGTHTGCAGGTGEGIDADVVGAAFAANEDKMYFDGVDDYVDVTGLTNRDSGYIEAEIITTGSPTGVICSTSRTDGDSSDRMYFALFSGQVEFRHVTSAGSYWVRTSSSFDFSSGKTVRATVVAGTSVTISVDGVDQSITIVNGTFNFAKLNNLGVAPIYNWIGARWFNSGGGASLASLFTGIILSLDYNGESSWVNTGNTDADWLDQIGSNNGTVNGSPVTVGQKRATILQTAGMDWNKYYYPDASWDSSGSTGFSYDASFTENSLNGFVGNTSSNFGLCMLDLDADVLTGDTVSIVLKVNSFTGATPRIGLDATQAPTAGAFVSNIVDLSVGIQTINLVATGTAKSIRVTQNTSPSTIDVEWFMITTSNGGTAMLSPASDATPTNDALGNAIAEPRPTADTWNLFGDGEYGRVADADSLDLTTAATWEMWLNPYGDFGVDKVFLSKFNSTGSQQSWLIYQNDTQLDSELSLLLSGNGTTFHLSTIPVTDTLSHIVITYNGSILAAYVNGASVAVSVISGTLPASIYVSTAPIEIGTVNTGGSPLERKISRPKIYNVALTADEVLKNYNAQKGAFGL